VTDGLTAAQCTVHAVGWLEPLLDRIALNESNVVAPVIDVVDDKTMQYKFGSAKATNVGGFEWNLQFNWHGIPEREMKRRKSDVDPLRFVTMFSHRLSMCCIFVANCLCSGVTEVGPDGPRGGTEVGPDGPRGGTEVGPDGARVGTKVGPDRAVSAPRWVQTGHVAAPRWGPDVARALAVQSCAPAVPWQLSYHDVDHK